MHQAFEECARRQNNRLGKVGGLGMPQYADTHPVFGQQLINQQLLDIEMGLPL